MSPYTKTNQLKLLGFLVLISAAPFLCLGISGFFAWMLWLFFGVWLVSKRINIKEVSAGPLSLAKVMHFALLIALWPAILFTS